MCGSRVEALSFARSGTRGEVARTILGAEIEDPPEHDVIGRNRQRSLSCAYWQWLSLSIKKLSIAVSNG